MREENPRTLATEMSKQIVYKAMLLRKSAINVAREAYARLDKISIAYSNVIPLSYMLPIAKLNKWQ